MSATATSRAKALGPMDTIEKTLTISNEKGLHVRAATLLAQTAGKFQSAITVEHAGERANAKSIMSLLLLTAAKGTRVRVTANGQDAVEAMDALSALIGNGFGE